MMMGVELEDDLVELSVLEIKLELEADVVEVVPVIVVEVGCSVVVLKNGA